MDGVLVKLLSVALVLVAASAAAVFALQGDAKPQSDPAGEMPAAVPDPVRNKTQMPASVPVSTNPAHKANVTPPNPAYGGSFPWDANNEFALKMYKAVSEKNPQENIFFSPTSIILTMAMIYEGAGGSTASEMEDSLHMPPDEGARWDNISSAVTGLRPDRKPIPEGYESFVDVAHVANSLWVREGLSPSAEYVGALETHYDSHVGKLYGKPSDYDRINGWVGDTTKKSIEKIVSPPDLKGAQIVLVNTAYFNARWFHEFEEVRTQVYCRAKVSAICPDIF